MKILSTNRYTNPPFLVLVSFGRFLRWTSFVCRSFTEVNSLLPHLSALNLPQNKLRIFQFLLGDFCVKLRLLASSLPEGNSGARRSFSLNSPQNKLRIILERTVPVFSSGVQRYVIFFILQNIFTFFCSNYSIRKNTVLIPLPGDSSSCHISARRRKLPS